MAETKSVCILYMEDDPGLARLLQKRLRRQGYQVDVAVDGETGLSQYQKQLNAGKPYALLVVDQHMPGVTGVKVIQRLAEKHALPPIIMVTGVGDENIAVEAMKLGARDYLVKDVEGHYLTRLPSVIEQVLAQEKLEIEKQQAVTALQQRTLDVQQATEQLLQIVVENLKTNSASVWLLEGDDPQYLVCYAVFDPERQDSIIGWRLESGEGIAGWVLQTGKTVVLNDTQSDERFYQDIDAFVEYQTESIIAVPLLARNSVIGVLEVINKLDGSFTEHDKHFVETLATSAALAIDNARLVETLHERNTILAARNEELDAFAGTVAHDLRSPLTPILGYATLLKTTYQENLGDKGIKIVQTIINNTEKMAEIIEALLLLSKLRHEQPDLEPIDIGRIVTEVMERLYDMKHDYKAEITKPDSWPSAIGYRPWIEQVWINYISNALKYGGDLPRIELKFTEQDDDFICFAVQDQGPGISAENQAQLFSPFTRLEKGKVEGYGLGLSIVKRIVEKLGGEVGIDSVVGEGSTFWFTLPSVP